MWVVHVVQVLCLSQLTCYGMTVVPWMRGVGGGCEMCMCLARDDVGEEGVNV